MNQLNNLGILVGSGRCNADCAHCCGKLFRPSPFRDDGNDDWERIEAVILDCYMKGVRRFSISGSGDPTLSPISVSKTLSIFKRLKNKRNDFNVKLYTNGILLGNSAYRTKYLSKWYALGLNTVCITVFSPDAAINAKVYQVTHYPNLQECIDAVRTFGLTVRVNVLLRVDVISTSDACKELLKYLITLDVARIVCNQVRTLDTDVVDFKISLSDKQLALVDQWVRNNVLRDKVAIRYGKKLCGIDHDHLTLFPDGTLKYDWTPNR